MADTDSDTTGWLSWLADTVAMVPVVGPALAQILRAPARIRRVLLWGIGLGVIYPLFVFVAVLWAIPLFPTAPKAWIQRLGNRAFDVDARITTATNAAVALATKQLNGDHVVLDGSMLMEFDVSDAGPVTRKYIERVATQQPVGLLTYQELVPASQQTCPIKSSDVIGTLTFTSIESPDGQDQFALHYAAEGFTNVDTVSNGHFAPAFSSADWKTFTDALATSGETLPRTVDFAVQFTPSEVLRQHAADCKMSVYVLMTYSKPSVR